MCTKRCLSLNKYLVILFDQWFILVSYFKEEVIQSKSVKISKNLKDFCVTPKRVKTDESCKNK